MIRTVKKWLNLKKLWFDFKVREKKRKRSESEERYIEAPKVTFVIQSFNHCDNIKMLAERLQSLPYQECIVCEDGSVDGSLRQWLKYFNRPNDFVIHSNDLHEIRTYDRALRYANGELVCLLQDDDAPPSTSAWFDEAVSLFNRYPDLIVLGGWLGFQGIESDSVEQKQYWSAGDLTNQYKKEALHSEGGGPMHRFVEAINVGPVFIRRKAFVDMGGFDLDFSQVGWPGIHFDVALSLQVWLQGGQVAWYDAGFRQAGARGTESFGNLDRRKQQLITNHKLLVEKFGEQMADIQKRVAESEKARTDWA
ncbi:hypothetical protein BOW53_05305 [Solemya pervernicosa gill symbiont]|uniref:Glycosyltransferase 2-like domain-containing protein n=2 Tax=Gammaproteobacteria incertae sedis TaxID=118884 RepID=A0A1T2L759_9GAMM|nr:glycosyltransferase [Candidatus Reidiella endopervernicosa]OOZ40948.1 hypothetical protein BOW53_05305 [Solemya pervernicosa gill symbiont]QKQ24997.1 glycosyltransferase [Candidatus Reidiella endopervernicosa]